MEVVSDFGTAEYFAVETLTLGIFNVWLGMNNIVARHRYHLLDLSLSSACSGWNSMLAHASVFSTTSKTNKLQPLMLRGRDRLMCGDLLPPLVFAFIPVGVLLKLFLLVSHANLVAVAGVVTGSFPAAISRPCW